MSQLNYVCALHLPELERSRLNPDTQKYFAKCGEKLGFVPNVLRSYSFNADKLAKFMPMYIEVGFACEPSPLPIGTYRFTVANPKFENRVGVSHTSMLSTIEHLQ